MADVRNLTIGVGFEVKSDALKVADENISRLIQSAKSMDAAFTSGFDGVAVAADKSTTATKDLGVAAEKTNSLLKNVGDSGKTMSSDIVDGADKAKTAISNISVAADKAKIAQKEVGAAGKTAGEDTAAGATRARDAMGRFVGAAQDGKEALKGFGADGKAAGDEADSGIQKVISGLQKLIDKAKSAKESLGTIGSNIKNGANSIGLGGQEKGESKLLGAAKESVAMFAPGMIAAQAVMSASEKLKEAFTLGFDYTKEQSGLQGTWKSLVDGSVGEGVDVKQAGSVGGITGTINDQARENARSLELVNEASQQTYHATESADRTKHLVQSELRIADAMGMSDDQAKSFAITGVGHSLDNGKMTGGEMNTMDMYAPAVRKAIARELLSKEQGIDMSAVSQEDVDAESKKLGGKKGLAAQGKVSSEDVENAINYLGDTKFKDAAKNAMATLPGMVRSVENGIPRIMSSLENGIMKPMGAWGTKTFANIAKWFNSADSQKQMEAFGEKLSGITQKIFSFGESVATALAPFASGFADGFVNGLKGIKSVWDTVSGVFKDIGDAIGKMLPKGTDKALGSFSKSAGEVAGTAVAFGGVAKLATKLPVVGGMASKALSKVSLVGGLFGKKSSGKDKALDTNTSALNKLTATLSEKLKSFAGDSSAISGSSSSSKSKKGKTGKLAGEAEAVEEELAGKSGKLGKVGVLAEDAEKVASKTGLLSKVAGAGKGIFGKLGSLGSKGMTALLGDGGAALGESSGLLGKIGGSIKGAGILGVGLSALDIGSTLMQKPSQEKNKALGGSIGGTVGGVAGAALGSLLGPLGTMAGGFIGNMAGNFIGEKIGGNKGVQKTFSNVGKGIRDLPKNVGNIGKDIGKGFETAHKTVDNVATSMKKIPVVGGLISHQMEAVSHPFKTMQNDAKNVASGFSNAGKEASGIAKGISSGISGAVNVAKTGASNIGKGFSAGLSTIGSVASKGMSAVGKSVDSGLNTAKSSMQNGMNTIKSAAQTGFNAIGKSVNDGIKFFQNLGSVVGGVVSSISSGISGLASSVGSAISSIGKAIGSIKLPHFANGGKTAGGVVMVNDQQGSVYQEAFMLPNGLTGLFPKQRNLYVPLPAGTEILNASETKKRFGYASGTPGAVAAFNALKGHNSQSSHQNGSVQVTVAPVFNINTSGDAGALQKQVENIVKPYLDMMAQALSAKMGYA